MTCEEINQSINALVSYVYKLVGITRPIKFVDYSYGRPTYSSMTICTHRQFKNDDWRSIIPHAELIEKLSPLHIINTVIKYTQDRYVINAPLPRYTLDRNLYEFFYRSPCLFFWLLPTHIVELVRNLYVEISDQWIKNCEDSIPGLTMIYTRAKRIEALNKLKKNSAKHTKYLNNIINTRSAKKRIPSQSYNALRRIMPDLIYRSGISKHTRERLQKTLVYDNNVPRQ